MKMNENFTWFLTVFSLEKQIQKLILNKIKTRPNLQINSKREN